MIRFLIALFLFFLMLCVEAQNLIPNPSAEDFIECPQTFGELENLDDWQAIRGTPDYFNNCTDSEFVGWHNALGYQLPRSGDGYIGLTTFNLNLPNAREFAAIYLSEALEIGQTYYITFHSSLAQLSEGGSRFATDNLGCLLMTENYLTSEPEGELLNFSQYSATQVLTDTSNWIEHTFSIVADSAYTMLAFGNFYDDSNTIAENFFPEEDSGVAYYYLDDFCVRSDSDDCEFISFINDTNLPLADVTIFPNPSQGKFTVVSEPLILSTKIWTIAGELIFKLDNRLESKYMVLEPILESGIYLLEVTVSGGTIRKRILINN